MESPFDAILKRLEQLTGQFQELREGVQKAVLVAPYDPEMALTRARKALEYITRDVYLRRIQQPPGTQPLENLLQRLLKDGFLPARLEAYATTIRKLGNVGTHSFSDKITAADVAQSLSQLMAVLEWYFESERPDAFAAAEVAVQPAGVAPAAATQPAALADVNLPQPRPTTPERPAGPRKPVGSAWSLGRLVTSAAIAVQLVVVTLLLAAAMTRVRPGPDNQDTQPERPTSQSADAAKPPLRIVRARTPATAQEITEAFQQRVYTLATHDGKSEATGTGFLLANDRSYGLILTCLSLLSPELADPRNEKKPPRIALPAVPVSARNATQLGSSQAKLAAIHRQQDLALLLIDVHADSPESAVIGRLKGVKQGERAVALGNSFSRGIFSFSGIILRPEADGHIWTDCPITSGCMGGPLFVERGGLVVGIMHYGLANGKNMAAIPLEEIVVSLKARQTEPWLWAEDARELALSLAGLIPPPE